MNKYICKAKRKDNGEWVEGYLIQGNRTYIATIEAINYMVVSTSCMASIEIVEVIPETVGQCTGLKDKNGKLIFEGDVVKDEQSGICYFIKWFPECACYSLASKDSQMNFGCDELEMFLDDLTVIGNIHDAPNLSEIEHDSLCETETYKAGDAKMTDKQIIKAFEEIIKYQNNKLSLIAQDVCADILLLVNRQKAEIGRLRERISFLEESIDYSRKEYNRLLQKLQQVESTEVQE